MPGAHGPDNAAVRIRQRHPVTQFTDQLRGIISRRQSAQGKSITFHRRDGLFAYNLAVVVDDHLQGVSKICRGADFRSNRQCGKSRCTSFLAGKCQLIHLPLALNPQGAKLPKQNHAPAFKSNPRPV
ncbi:glutamate--tRNA ligase family protein [Shigella flexneri]